MLTNARYHDEVKYNRKHNSAITALITNGNSKQRGYFHWKICFVNI